MKAVRQARLELSGGSTPDQLKPTPPAPPSPKCDVQFQGIEASESKNPLGDRGQNNDFTRGWTSNIMGYATRTTPKKGGIRRTCLRLI